MHWPDYRPHKAFIAPASPRNAMWRLVLGFFLIELAYRSFYVAFDALAPVFWPDFALDFYIGDTPLSLTAQLLSFAALGLAVFGAVKLLHRRGPLTLVGNPDLAVHDFMAVLIPLFALLIFVEVLPPWWEWSALAATPDYLRWLGWLPLAGLAIFIQISAEELLYRGYLQQQLAAVFNRPVYWMVLTNAIFGLAHYEAASGGTASLQYVIWAFFMGLACSDLVARTGTLGAALAFHFANNMLAFMLYGELGGNSSGYALFLFPEDSMSGAFSETDTAPLITGQLAFELLVLLLMWITARIGLRR